MKILMFANTDWYLYNFRLGLAKALRERGDQVVLVSPDGDYSIKLQESGFRWVCFPMAPHGTNPLVEFLTILRLLRLYKREKPDLVHHFTIKCVLYGSLVSHLVGIHRVVNSVTGLGFVFIERDSENLRLRELIKILYRLILNRTRVIFQNASDKNLFLKFRLVKENQVSIIQGSGVDTTLFSPQSFLEGSPLVILPARLLWDKGVGEFVKAARQLKKEGIDARFALVGDTDYKNPAGIPAEQIKAWMEEGVVESWGWKKDMVEVYAQAHIVCLPSYREGTSKTLIEAAACGRPLITCDVPGCREVVPLGINGLLVSPRDVQGLMRAMRYLIENPDKRKVMGNAGRKIAEDLFSMDLIISQTITVYDLVQSSQLKREM